MLTGSIGMLPNASIGGEVGLYTCSGSAPDIAGQNKANPGHHFVRLCCYVIPSS